MPQGKSNAAAAVYWLHICGELNSAQMAEKLDVCQESAQKTLERLCEDGFVVRYGNPRAGYAYSISDLDDSPFESKKLSQEQKVYRALKEAGEPMTVPEVSEATGLRKGNAFAMLANLVKAGVVKKSEQVRTLTRERRSGKIIRYKRAIAIYALAQPDKPLKPKAQRAPAPHKPLLEARTIIPMKFF